MTVSFKPGQTIRCTITRAPRSHGATTTIRRLMQQNHETRKRLRRSQKARRDQMDVYIRGGRRWHNRKRCGKSLEVSTGQSWDMTYVPHLASDLASVEEFLEIKGA